MRARHSAALAIIGWYLIVPPSLAWQSKQTQLANILAERWKVIEKHKTEKMCLASLDRLEIQTLHDWLRKDPTLRSMQRVNRRLAAECVDDSDARIRSVRPEDELWAGGFGTTCNK
jgi:hypothetical protein